VSTILKALQEQERRRPTATRQLPSEPGSDASRRWRIIAAVAVLLAAGTSASVLLRLPSEREATETVQAPIAEARRTAPAEAAVVALPPDRKEPAPKASAPAVVAAPTVAPRAPVEEPPRGRIVRRQRPASASPPEKQGRLKEERPSVPVASAPPPQERRIEPKESTASSPPAAGQMGITLRAISYAKEANKRTATLAIEGAGVVTLAEGESAGDVEVQLILSDVVYVYRDGMVFGLSPAR
jgi:hypothetical protein